MKALYAVVFFFLKNKQLNAWKFVDGEKVQFRREMVLLTTPPILVPL